MIDCSDLARSAEFWAQVLGYVPEGPALGTYQGLIPADGQGVEILLQRVPEGSWNGAITSPSPARPASASASAMINF